MKEVAKFLEINPKYYDSFEFQHRKMRDRRVQSTGRREFRCGKNKTSLQKLRIMHFPTHPDTLKTVHGARRYSGINPLEQLWGSPPALQGLSKIGSHLRLVTHVCLSDVTFVRPHRPVFGPLLTEIPLIDS